ncbi:potassium channel family protein [Moorena sp. SIOASIH]|uniref:potassium channel family protein n=1 Tax=Moorena sp. SIOASIH TaxID=2607817 RepID=UPI0025F5A8AC|nr:potassium channel family protein [Moorena sp. SIOASIH]
MANLIRQVRAHLAGIWESLWWSLVKATTVGYGDKSPVSFVGRLVAIVWMFTGLFVVAYFTAAITADRLEQKRDAFPHLFQVGVKER